MTRSARLLFVLLLGMIVPGTVFADDEVARLREHFRTVERELLARDVSHLSPGRRAARARNVQILREYREAGLFPHNHDFPGELRPYFVDRHGTLCAMAYLIARSGRMDLVEQVAATRNHAYLPELAGNRELAAWLDASGLSLEEAARIQPTYRDGEIDPEYKRQSTVMLGLEGASILWNLFGPSRHGVISGVTGVLVGSYGTVFFGINSSMDGDNERLNGLHRTAGAATVLAGAWGIGRWVYQRGGASPAEGGDTAEPRVSASPWIGADGERGVAVRVGF